MATKTEAAERLINGQPAVLPASQSSAPLEVCILHTREKQTREAFRIANVLARGLARMRLLVLQVVPYPLPLDEPSVPLAVTEKLFLGLVEDTQAEVCVDIRLGRDPHQMLEAAFPQKALVVIGGRPRWWLAKEARIAKRLERLGHEVVFAGRN